LDPALVAAVGEAGAQLASALRLAGNHQIVSFLDDVPRLWRRTINGIPIQPPQVLSEIQEQLDQVLLAIPSLPRSERRRIVSELQRQANPVLQIPSVDDLTSGRARIRVSDVPPHPHGAWGDLLPARLSGRGCGGCGG
jgi:FlaA1/EpsC-like NDP-sugar epimerase